MPVQACTQFEASTDDAKRITSMLSAICLSAGKQGGSSTTVVCEVNEKNGMVFTIAAASKSLQAIAVVKPGAFSNWQFAPEQGGEVPSNPLQFCINLTTLVECLKIFASTTSSSFDGTSSTAEVVYRADTACLWLTLVDGFCVTQCMLHTLDLEAPMRRELQVLNAPLDTPLRVLIPSDALKSAVDELEWGDANEKRVTLRAAVQPPALSLTVASADLGCEMVLPAEMLIRYEAAAPLEHEYRFRMLHMALRSLKDSNTAQISVDEIGVIEIRLRFPGLGTASGSTELFAVFSIFPLTDEDNAEWPP
jgi:hypothetical protein